MVAKELLALPSFNRADTLHVPDGEAELRTGLHARGTQCYASLRAAPLEEHLELLDKQAEVLEMSRDEADIEHAPIAPQVAHAIPGRPPGATFATQTVYSTPSALVRALIRALPPSEQLTRDLGEGRSRV